MSPAGLAPKLKNPGACERLGVLSSGTKTRCGSNLALVDCVNYRHKYELSGGGSHSSESKMLHRLVDRFMPLSVVGAALLLTLIWILFLGYWTLRFFSLASTGYGPFQ